MCNYTIGKRKRKGAKKEKAKAKEKESTIAKPNQQIKSFFNNSALKAALKPKPAPVSDMHAQEVKNMANLI